MTDVEARLAEIKADAATVTESLLKLQAWVSKPGSLKWSRDGLDALARLLARLKEHDERISEALSHMKRERFLDAERALERETNETFVSSGGELIRVVTPEEADNKWNVCCWTWREQPNCVRRVAYRLATPHGHMDFCAEHIDNAIASLPTEWVKGWAYREPVAVEGDSDDIPF